MIRIKSSIVEGIQAAETPLDLRPFLQQAVTLELATIPTYLTGLFTLGTGVDNAAVAQILSSVANEEMLHMCIAANVLTALGGGPVMNTPAAVPSFPGPLPGDADDGLVIHLRPFSADVVLNTYMRIEEPDEILQPSGPRKIPLVPPAPPQPGQFQSIGDFYRAIIAKVQQLPAGAIDSNPASPNQKNQVVQAFDSNNQPARITDIPTAVAALNLILDQGEGASSSPLETDPVDPDETPAHFYRFAEIVMGRKIVITGDSYDFSGAAVTFDATRIANMFPDPTLAVMRTLLSPADFGICQAFSAKYTELLDALNAVFNGNPAGLDAAVGKMFALARLAKQVLAIQVGNTGMTAGLCFELFRPSV